LHLPTRVSPRRPVFRSPPLARPLAGAACCFGEPASGGKSHQRPRLQLSLMYAHSRSSALISAHEHTSVIRRVSVRYAPDSSPKADMA
jgi:hypothetical protein